jgi:hypothetical protein
MNTMIKIRENGLKEMIRMRCSVLYHAGSLTFGASVGKMIVITCGFSQEI